MNVDASLNPVTITLVGDDDARDTCSGLLMALRELALAVTAPEGEAAPAAYARALTRRTCAIAMANRDTPLHLLLTPTAPWIDGSCLLAPRWVHELAGDLRDRLAAAGIAEITLLGEPEDSDLDAFEAACRGVHGSPLRDQGMLRWRDASALALTRGVDLESCSPQEQVLTVGSTAAAEWSGVEKRLHEGGPETAAQVRRIAAMLTGLPGDAATALLRRPGIRARLGFRAERCVLRAMLAQVMLERLDVEPAQRIEAVLVALALEGMIDATQLEPHVHPSAIARRLHALGIPGDDPVLRAAIGFEASWLARPDLGPLPSGREAPSVHAAVVRVAFRCMTDPTETHEVAVDSVVKLAHSELDRAVARLVASVLGVRPRWPVPVRADAFRRSRPAETELRATPEAPRSDDEEAPVASLPEPELFSEADMDDIASDLLTDSSALVPGASVLPRPRKSSRVPPRRASSPAPTDTARPIPRHRTTPPPAAPPVALVPGSLIDDSERRAKARAAFESAEALCRQQAPVAALEQADAAVMLMPQEPAYLALQAYLEGHDLTATQADREALIQRLERAFLGSSPNARAQYWRGMLLRSAGKMLAAKQAFRKGLEQSPEDPELLEAASLGSVPPPR